MRVWNQENFIKEAISVHGNKYIYTNTLYTHYQQALTITCPIHGDFKQTPLTHVSGSGCKKCGYIKVSTALSMSFEEFQNNAHSKFNHKYTYLKDTYTNGQGSVVIDCPIHGMFKQQVNSHLQGAGCTKCGHEGKRNKLSHKDLFSQKAKVIHKDNYKYEKVKYKNNKTPVIITCKIHGDFSQTPQNHLRGQGCPVCGNKKKQNTWSYTSWETAGNSSKFFKGYSFYILECHNEKEKFYKVGKTYVDIQRRYKTKKCLPYEWKIIYQKYGSAKYISELEYKIKQQLVKYSYTPEKTFGGRTECYTMYIKELLT